MSAKPPPDPRRLVVPQHKGREILIGVACAAGLLAILVWATLAMKSVQTSPSTNQLTGEIVEKIDYHEREEEISIGRKGLKTQEGDPGYAFKVRVDPSGKIYELPVSKKQFDGKKLGEKQSFIRPPSEQR